MSTYCISDLHGHWNNLARFLEKLKKRDRVFLLGDVVDKGPESIRILQYVMQDERFTMLLGNHEHMMWQYLKTLSASDYFQWVLLNHGSDTLSQYEKLTKEEQQEIMDFIENLPLNVPDLKVKGRMFYLVHAMPSSENPKTMKDLNYDGNAIADYIWSRYDGETLLADRTVIAGHTPVQFYGIAGQPFYSGEDLKSSDFIDIDGGLAGSIEGCKLIALKLDDLTYQTY
ncbi:MAG: metallophosphoesterase [Erysipelotrichaceae bacterium]|nr:metallophosphoesterase [Erysipelotrichaceae bacterium]